MTGSGERARVKAAARVARRRRARVTLLVMDVVEAAAGAVSAELAVPVVEEVVARLDEAQLRAVVVELAVVGVWHLPPSLVIPRTGDEIRWRLVEVRRWVQGVRRLAWRAAV